MAKIEKTFGELNIGDHFFEGSDIDPNNCWKTSESEAIEKDGTRFTDIKSSALVRPYTDNPIK